MLGKAVYEGIVIELPLADFFVAKLLGRYPGFDLLPSLDAQLHASLEQVKVYDGDVENDLCLSFSVEEEQFGARSTVELRDGGAAIPVTADNRIEYVPPSPTTTSTRSSRRRRRRSSPASTPSSRRASASSRRPSCSASSTATTRPSTWGI